MSKGIKLHVIGDFACFTRPEMKVERVSYDVITPSAARGILEAIYWKPQIRWVIDRIHVLKPIRFTNIRRNEVAHKASKPDTGIVIEDARQQRASTLLRNVSYLIEAHFEVKPPYILEKDGQETSRAQCENKHINCFNRRARKGQYFHHPYLGTREFPARFTLIEDGTPSPASELPSDQLNRPLGWMLHDIAFHPADKNAKDSFITSQGKRVRAEPRFFNAELKDGILEVPPFHTTTA